MITIPPSAEIELSHQADFLQPAASGHLVAASVDGRLSLLAPDLTLTGQLDFGRKLEDVATSDSGDALAICAGDSLSIVRSSDGRKQVRVPLGPGGASRFGDHATIWTVQSEDGEHITIQLRDANNGRVVRERSLAGPACELSCSLHPQPRPGGVALWVAAGQEGQWIFWVHDRGDRIVVSRARGISECTPPCFNASGKTFLTATVDSLSCWSFPELSCLEEIDEWPWSETDDDSLGSSVAWVGAHRALVTTNENGLYLVDLENENTVDEVAIDGHPLRPIGGIFVVPMKMNRVALVIGENETSRLILLDTTSLIAL